MGNIEVSRTKVEIATDCIKLVLSPITGHLESIISLPYNIEWVGKTSFLSFIGIDGKDIFQTVLDTHFSEVYDEESASVLQTIIGEEARLNIKYLTFSNLPVIIIESKLLLTECLSEKLIYHPIQFELHKDIQAKQLQLKTTEKYYFVTLDNEYILYFFHESDSFGEIANQSKVRIVCKSPISFKGKREIILPFSYISSTKIENMLMIDTLHSRVIKKYQSYIQSLSSRQPKI